MRPRPYGEPVRRPSRPRHRSPGHFLLLLLPFAACGAPTFDPARFVGTWTGELTQERSGTRLPTSVDVTASGDTLRFVVDIRGGAPEAFEMEVVDGVARLAETKSPRFGTVHGTLQADGYLKVAGEQVPGPLDWFELFSTWSESEVDADINFGLDVGPGGKARLSLRR